MRKRLSVLLALLVGLTVAATCVWGQSRFGYGPFDTGSFYRGQSRGYGISPYQNSQFGYGVGRFGYAGPFGQANNTRFGQQLSPYGSQLGSYGHQYNNYGGPVPSNWSPANPVYNPALVGTVPPPSAATTPPAQTAPLLPAPPPPAPATRPALPRSNAAPAATTQPSPPA